MFGFGVYGLFFKIHNQDSKLNILMICISIYLVFVSIFMALGRIVILKSDFILIPFRFPRVKIFFETIKKISVFKSEFDDGEIVSIIVNDKLKIDIEPFSMENRKLILKDIVAKSPTDAIIDDSVNQFIEMMSEKSIKKQIENSFKRIE